MAAQNEDTTVASIEFTLDRDAMVSISTGGVVFHMLTENTYMDLPNNTAWVTMNGDSLKYSRTGPDLNANYFFALPSGTYKFDLKVNAMGYLYSPKPFMFAPRIQALIILSDTTQNCVAENPRGNDDNPLLKAIIASGPTIRVTGCSKIVDITGRDVKFPISNDEVMIKDLPRGTYFVTGNRQNIKVVKM